MLCVFTAMQRAKFPQAHLEGGGWYLDCFPNYVPPQEQQLFDSLIRRAPNVVVLMEEPIDAVEPVVVPNEKDVMEVKGKTKVKGKGKGKGKKAVAQSSTHVTERSYTVASIHPTSTPTTTIVGSPSIAPSIAPSITPLETPEYVPDPSPIGFPSQSEAPSQSGASLPIVPRKRKALAPDTSATSSGAPSTLLLLENVDMVQEFEVMETKGEKSAAFIRIEDFIKKVRLLELSILCSLCL